MHCCDWQSALVPFYLREHHAHNPFFRHTRTVLTLHNGAYQGHHAFEWHEAIGIHPKFMIPGLFEDRSSLNLMKGGIVLSHRVTTVSPNYRDELLTAEMGHGLHHTLMPRSASFVGILNGVDNDAWSPEFDVLQPIAFDESSLDKKEECKRLLQEKLGLAVDRERPLFAYIGRIAHQKGFELMLPALEELLPTGIQAVFVGHGEARYQGPMADLQSRYPDSFRYVNDFSPEATRPVLGASDFLLMPSLFEPCGLTQLYAMRYGTIPIVTPVGGLKSTVTPVDTTPEALKVTIKEAIKDFKTAPMVIHQLRLNAMRKRFLWSTAAEQYLTIYFDLTGGIDPMASLVKR
jgi:starch synthase